MIYTSMATPHRHSGIFRHVLRSARPPALAVGLDARRRGLVSRFPESLDPLVGQSGL